MDTISVECQDLGNTQSKAADPSESSKPNFEKCVPRKPVDIIFGRGPPNAGSSGGVRWADGERSESYIVQILSC